MLMSLLGRSGEKIDLKLPLLKRSGKSEDDFGFGYIMPILVR